MEAWRKLRRTGLQTTEAPETVPRRPGAAWVIGGVVAILAAAAAGYWLMQRSALPFEQRDWALIAQFENRTGETVFDGTVEYALEREISNSRFVNVVPRERISDSLRLMKKGANTIVDPSVGREICLRDGGIRALITGRVEKLDNTYVLSAALVNPESGVTVATFSERALGLRETVGAVQRLSERVREGLGEELPGIGRSVQKLQRVSTPSLRALQLYSHADAMIREHRNDQAEPMLREALQQDPDFASAHVLLAHSLSNLGRHEEAGPHYQRALELSKSSTDAERLFIQAGYYEEFLGDNRRAVEALELLVRLYPDHYWASSNLLVGYHSIGQPRRALPYFVRRADLRPDNFDIQLRAAHALLLLGKPRDAEPYLERARRLIKAEEDFPARSWRAAWLRLYPAHAEWIQGDFEGAIQETTTLASQVESSAELDLNPIKWESGSFYLNVGRMGAAREMFQRMTGPSEYLALIALGLDDEQAVKKHLNSAGGSHRSAILMARAGMLSEAEKAIADPEALHRVYAPFIPAVWETMARGELALARGQAGEAIPLLQEGVEKLRTWPTPYFFLGVEALARAWQQQGDMSKSIAVLEEASEYGPPAIFWGPAPFFWMKNELRRAELYRRAGRETDRRTVLDRLSKLLIHADSDFPILRELRRSEKADQLRHGLERGRITVVEQRP